MTKLAVYVGYNISYFLTAVSVFFLLLVTPVQTPTNDPLLSAAEAKALSVLQDQEHTQQERRQLLPEQQRQQDGAAV